jgi:SAM-dependent methyltransferase
VSHHLPPPTAYPRHRGFEYLPDFWDYYTWLPELYHRFAISSDAGVEQLHRLHSLSGLRVLDVAAGTGRSAFAMARHAAQVVGVEPEHRMRLYSLEKQRELGVTNVQFLEGSTSELPADHHPFDLVTMFHGPPFFTGDDDANRTYLRGMVDSLRALLQPHGAIAIVWAISGWEHPYLDLAPAGTSRPAYDPAKRAESLLVGEGFIFSDELLEMDYGSLEEALGTYGFIYGPYAIDWLLERQSSVVYFGNRVYLRRF